MAEAHESLIRIMALHALAYCERLFYLEKVEAIQVADHRVYGGRTLHEAEVDTDGEGQLSPWKAKPGVSRVRLSFSAQYADSSKMMEVPDR